MAKTISAYDMKFSDEIYGRAGRYVSRERLLAMLEREYALLIERLDADRGEKSRFFVFADTVAARNFSGTNECHGWMGLRFQLAPRGAPHDVLLHVNLRDPTNLLQQQALGILGVNLVHAAFFEAEGPEAFLAGLRNELPLERIEVDALELRGPRLPSIDSVGIGSRLVREPLAHAVLFDAEKRLVPPSELLRKRPLVIERGQFVNVAPLHRRMLGLAHAKLRTEIEPDSEREAVLLPEHSIAPVGEREAPDAAETERRLRELLARDTPVLLTRFPEVYHLTSYLKRYTQEPLRFVLGSSTALQVLHQAHYRHLTGGLLEALGRLFADNVKIYVYPMEVDAFRGALAAAGIEAPAIETGGGKWVTAASLRLEPPLRHLYDYLLDTGWIVALDPPES